MPKKTEIRCFKRWLYLKELDTLGKCEKKKVLQYTNEEDSIDSSSFAGDGPSPSSIVNNANTCTQWTKEEDKILKVKVEHYGTQNWVIIARFLPGRLGRQCRERWHNVIDPSIVRREWTR